MTDEELGALLLKKARAEKKIVTLSAGIKASAASLLRLADTLAGNPSEIVFKNLPGEVGQWPMGAGRQTEFEWTQVDTAIVAKRLLDLREAYAEIEDADKQIALSEAL